MCLQIMDILTALVGAFSTVLYIETVFFPSMVSRPGLISEVARYSWTNGGPDIGSLTLNGQCFAPGGPVRCIDLHVGQCLKFFSGPVVLYEIFFGVTALATLATIIFFRLTVESDSAARPVAKELRVAVLAVLYLASMLGTVVSFGGVIVYILLPAYGRGLGRHVDVSIGSGQITVILLTVGLNMMALGFYNESREVLRELPGGVTLHSAEENALTAIDEKRDSDISELLVMA